MIWTEELSVGIEKIDKQHQELFNRINRLVDAIKQHRCKEEIDNTIKFLDDYAREHFADEEKYMKESSYQELLAHRSHHARYLENLAELKKEAGLPRIQGGSYDLSVMTNQIVVDWIVDHIMKLDKKFGAFIKTGRRGDRKGS